ncbi:MAG: hypothetical protein R6U96_03890 [Promethearchaeia archaeon]
MIRKDLSKDYTVEVEVSEAPVLNKYLREPESYERTLADLEILENEVLIINEAIKNIFGKEKGLDLKLVRLGIGATKNDYVTIDESDLRKVDIESTLDGLLDFIGKNRESVVGFLDRKYNKKAANIEFLNCYKGNLSDEISSIKLKILASLKQRSFFLKKAHKYYGLQMFLTITTKTFDDDKLIKLLRELGIDWELVIFRRRMAIDDWIEKEVERNSRMLKRYFRYIYDVFNSYDIDNIVEIIVENQVPFKVAKKMAKMLKNVKKDRVKKSRKKPKGLTLKKAEIIAAAQLVCSYLGIDIDWKSDVPENEILKLQEEFTSID